MCFLANGNCSVDPSTLENLLGRVELGLKISLIMWIVIVRESIEVVELQRPLLII